MVGFLLWNRKKNDLKMGDGLRLECLSIHKVTYIHTCIFNRHTHIYIYVYLGILNTNFSSGLKTYLGFYDVFDEFFGFESKTSGFLPPGPLRPFFGMLEWFLVVHQAIQLC